jgi:hypothetical protein
VTTALASQLEASDRCDRCGARAYVRATLAAGELLFCAHHARQHEARLREVALHWHDETEQLADTPATARDGER